jgi:NitT/TauT family transport system substrate-binding protein
MFASLTNPGERSTGSGRRRLARRAAAVGVLALSMALVAACSSSSKSTGSDSAGGSGSAAGNGSLKTITIALPSAAITAFSANYSIGDYLGCYKQFGYKVNVTAVNTPAALIAAFQRGSVDVGVPGSDQFVTMVDTIGKSGSSLPLKAFYELDYPFRYGMIVKANSNINSLQDLAGKSVGIAAVSDSSNPTLNAIEKQNGMAAGAIKTIATGVGAASAQALQSGKVTGLWINDTGVGSVIQAGVDVKVIAPGGKKPFINAGGILAVTTQKEYTSEPKMFQAVAQCTTEGSIFSQANPSAASYILLKMFPKLGLVGQSLDKQIANLALGLTLRAPLFHSTDASVPYGQMNAEEFSNDQTVLLNMPAGSLDMTPYWTNDLIAAANSAVNKDAITQQAKNFKIPGITGQVTLPAIPPNAP